MDQLHRELQRVTQVREQYDVTSILNMKERDSRTQPGEGGGGGGGGFVGGTVSSGGGKTK